MDKVLIFGVIAIITILVSAKTLQRWSVLFQHYMAREAKRQFDRSMGWERPWMTNVAKAMIILWGFVLIMGAYTLLFEAIHLERGGILTKTVRSKRKWSASLLLTFQRRQLQFADFERRHNGARCSINDFPFGIKRIKSGCLGNVESRNQPALRTSVYVEPCISWVFDVHTAIWVVMPRRDRSSRR